MVCTPEIHVTSSDLQFIADPSVDNPAGYHSVYPEKRRWVPRAFKRRLAPPQETPRLAAEIVVRWWKRKYGERWRSVWAMRQTQGWGVLRVRGGVWAVVEIRGEAGVLVGRGPDGRAGEAATTHGCRPFADKRDAAKGVREWAAAEFGEAAPHVVRRTWAPERNRMTPVPQSASC